VALLASQKQSQKEVFLLKQFFGYAFLYLALFIVCGGFPHDTRHVDIAALTVWFRLIPLSEKNFRESFPKMDNLFIKRDALKCAPYVKH
jgi:hypothetical protein